MVKRLWEERLEETRREEKIGIMPDDSPLACPYCGGEGFSRDEKGLQYQCNSCGASGPISTSCLDRIKELSDKLRRLSYLKRERNLLFFSLPPDLDFKNVSINKKGEFYMKWNKGTTNTAVGAIEMLESLRESVKFAGGDPDKFTVEDLKNMSAMDLIAHLGSNHIRFYSEIKSAEEEES